MTRRYVVFVDTDGRRHVAGEYNGCKSEYAARETLFGVSWDRCDKDWKDIQEEFNACKTLDDFKATVARVDGYYHSFLGATPSEIQSFGTQSASITEYNILVSDADEVVIVGHKDKALFWSEYPTFRFNSKDRGLTVYTLEEFQVYDDVELDASTIGLFDSITAARSAFKERLARVFMEEDFVGSWAKESTFQQTFHDDCYECRRNPENSVDGYRLQIKPIRLALSEPVFTAIGQAYRNWVLTEDFKAQLDQDENLESVPEEKILTVLSDPDLPSQITSLLNSNESYMESYWLTMEEVAGEKFYPKKVQTVSIEKERSEWISGLLTNEPKDMSECFGEDESFTVTATFDNGVKMDIMLCGVQYEEGGSNTPWTQAVLIAPNGSQLVCTDPSDSFFGPWELEHDGITYITLVLSVGKAVKGGNDHGV